VRTASTTPSRVWPYYVLTFSWSWLFWISTALLGLDIHHRVTQIGFGLGGLGPMIFGFFFTRKDNDKKVFKDYLRRIWDWRNLTLFWWVMALLMVPALTGVAGLIDQLLGGGGCRLNPQIFHIAQLPLILTVPMIVFFVLCLGPLPEEMGWRGYALDRLQKRNGPWKGSLLLGFYWGMWHLPLFFIAGSPQNVLGIGTAAFWLFFVEVMAVCPIMTWIYNHTGRSILSAVLFHFACNMTATLVIRADRLELLWILLCLLWILVVVVWGKDRSLGYGNGTPSKFEKKVRMGD
jgi:membrane protease YdiL (CAAX protease family)